eukprot:gene35578-43871_t
MTTEPRAAPTAQPLLGFGQVRHTRLRPARHAFAYATFFAMLPLRTLAEGGSPGALAVNRRGAISFHDVDHGDGRSAEQGGALAWLDGLLRAEGIDDASGEIAKRRGKIAVFRRQMGYLFVALRNRSLLVTLLLWMVGNAVYTVLYNYEVSVYEELHGSNAWNGSVLAVMLLLGSIGAMAATWLHPEGTGGEGQNSSINNRHNKHKHGSGSSGNDHINEHDNDTTPPVSERSLALRLSAALILSSVCLFLFVGAWKTLPSVAFLGLFFGTWQYVNVIVYAQLALQLKVAQLSCSGGEAHLNALTAVLITI